MRHTEMNNNYIYFAIIAIGVASILNPAYGFFHDHNDPNPPKPELKLLNPVIQNEFDTLYNKYPDISQNDIDVSYAIMVDDCMAYQQSDPDNFFASFACRAVNTGLLQGYLEQLGLKLEPSTDEYGNVGKSPQLWN